MIYLLEEDPTKNAQCLDDIALDKQIIEIAQTLCNVHYLEAVYSPLKIGQTLSCLTKNIPLPLKNNDKGISASHDSYSKWGITCRANYLQLVEMGSACCEEWKYRFNLDKETIWNNPESYAKKSCKKCKGCGTYLVYVGSTTKNVGIIDHNEPVLCKCLKVNKAHKFQPIIEWANENTPELPDNYKKDTITIEINGIKQKVLSPTFKQEMTPFPLVIPNKYIGNSYRYKCEYCNRTNCHSYDCYCIESYRNYYRAKLLNNKIKCKKCCGDPCIVDHYCKECSCTGFIKTISIWTRREKPTWLNLEGEK